MVKRIFGLMLCCILLSVSIVSYASNGVSDLLSQVPESFHLTLGVSLQEWMPLDEERCRQLSDLLRHLEMDIGKYDDLYLLDLAVDGAPCVSIYMEENDSFEQVSFNTVPGIRFQGKENLLSALLMTETDQTERDSFSLIREMFMLDDFGIMLKNMLESEQFEKIDKPDKQNVAGYGTTTRRVSFAVTESLMDSVANMFTDTPLSNFLGMVTFSGKQDLYLLVTDDNIIHKAAYSGNIENAAGLWKVTASWRMGRKDSSEKDGLKVEASRKVQEGEKRESITWTLSREKADEQEKCVWQRIHKTGQIQKVHTVSGELTWNAGHIQGTCELRESEKTAGKNGKLLRLTPDLQFSESEPYIDGNVDIRYTVNGVNPYSGTISVQVTAQAPPAIPNPEETIQYDLLNSSEKTVWSDKILTTAYGAILRELVLIDASDSVYLRQGLADSDWMSILYTAGPVVEEE